MECCHLFENFRNMVTDSLQLETAWNQSHITDVSQSTVRLHKEKLFPSPARPFFFTTEKNFTDQAKINYLNKIFHTISQSTDGKTTRRPWLGSRDWCTVIGTLCIAPEAEVSLFKSIFFRHRSLSAGFLSLCHIRVFQRTNSVSTMTANRELSFPLKPALINSDFFGRESSCKCVHQWRVPFCSYCWCGSVGLPFNFGFFCRLTVQIKRVFSTK